MRAISFSKGISSDKNLALALGRDIVPVRQAHPIHVSDIVVGWGAKPNTKRARAFARQNRLRFVALEDGFIAYRGHRASPRLSVVVDDSGIYYQSSTPSALERLLQESEALTEYQYGRIDAVLQRIRRAHISKYNGGSLDIPPAVSERLGRHVGPVVLVVDQTYGDQSIVGAGASDASFQAMLAAARRDNPDALVLIKVHPDVLSGKAKGHFGPADADTKTLLIGEDIAPQRLLARVDRVYVVSSQYGFEALIAGKPVVTFGVPFYAGWGLTDDRMAISGRTARCDMATLAHRALIDYCHYIDPYRGRRVQIEDVLDLIEADRAMERPRVDTMFAVDFSLWKRAFIPSFLGAGVKRLRFVGPRGAMKARDADALLLWGRKSDTKLGFTAATPEIWRMEDGFLRSAGLGSDLKRPSSLVLDRRGIYFDATTPSDIEAYLEAGKIVVAQRRRARDLIDQILAARVSKYNVGVRQQVDFTDAAEGRRIILVAGQVEGDASLRYGAPVVNTNAGLLKAVRADHPDAYIVYKPHPDVLSGNRPGVALDAAAEAAYDTLVTNVDILDCVDAADEVHVMTSLTGFEALMRGKRVTTYGLPFYAGWGLTDDKVTSERRTRWISLEELVYAALIAYPVYVDWETGRETTPEALVARLAKAERSGALTSSSVGRFFRKMGFLLSALLR